MGLNANVLKFDKNNLVKDFTFILSTRNYTHLGKLNNIKRDTVHTKGNLNSMNELSFELYKSSYVQGEIIGEKLWYDVTDLNLIYVKELEEYFEARVSYKDSISSIKTVTCTSLCEAELSQVVLFDTEINTEADIARIDYEETIFYNEDNPKASLLHRILKDKAPHYTIRHVDDSLKKLQRSFSISGTSIYEFLTGECAEQFNCLFVFYSKDRSISVYDLYTVCNDCGYRGAYSDFCPECGSDFLNYFGEDTTIFISKDNLTDEIQLETDVDSIKNCFRLVAGDDKITAAVTDLNRTGTQYMYYFSEEQKKYMTEDLVKRINDYDLEYSTYDKEYEDLLLKIWEATDKIGLLTSSMMPESEKPKDEDDKLSVAEKEAKKLTIENLSPMGVYPLNDKTSVYSINNAIESYARIYVNTGHVKVSVNESFYEFKGTDSSGFGYGQWTGNFTVSNYSDKEDVVVSPTIVVKVIEDYKTFIEQKVMKDITLDDEEYSVYNVLDIDDLELFENALKEYSLNRLVSFQSAIRTAIDCLITEGQGTDGAELYEAFYIPYCDKLELCDTEIALRESQIQEVQTEYDNLNKRKREIQNALNFENYLGEDLYREFCTYRREQEFSNSNYISDGLSDAKVIERAKEFLENAKKELYKSATGQKSISTNLYNLLAIPECKNLTKKFALGNFIRVKVDKDIYRLRLVSYEINFSDLTMIPVEFSDMTKTADGMNDVANILKSAQSMSSSYAYVTKQAEKGEIANTAFEDMYNEGLNSALYQIKNNTNEEVTFDKGGLLGRAWDDILNDFSPEQVRLTHNILAFTTDGWRSVRQALGKHNYYKFVDDKLGQYTAYGLCNEEVFSSIVKGVFLC